MADKQVPGFHSSVVPSLRVCIENPAVYRPKDKLLNHRSCYSQTSPFNFCVGRMADSWEDHVDDRSEEQVADGVEKLSVSVQREELRNSCVYGLISVG